VQDVEKQQAKELHVEAPRLDDTLTFDEDDDVLRRAENESRSQRSQGTDPISSGVAETPAALPDPVPPPAPVAAGETPQPEVDRLRLWVIGTVSLAAMATVGIVASLVWKMLS